MKIETQSGILSMIVNNNLEDKIKNDPDFRKEIIKNIKEDDIDKTFKNKIYKEALITEFNLDGSYDDYSPAQIYNIGIGKENNIDTSSYDNKENSSNYMFVMRQIEEFNKKNPENVFDVNNYDKNNINKLLLLLTAHKFNIENPDNKIDLSILVNEYDMAKARNIFEEHKNKKNITLPVRSVEIKVENKKEPKKTQSSKDTKKMTYGELADYWNMKNPKSKINSTIIYAQSDKRIAEMLYIGSIYNLKFIKEKVPLEIFLQDDFNIEQKETILLGLKYNLKNDKNTIPVIKYIHADIPEENMKLLFKIMVLQTKNKNDINIDFIINNYTEEQQLKDLLEELSRGEENV